ncbi:helix-turn-helix domain-containing protein [Paenibacillus sp. FSL W8-1187]|uniref:Arabinose operon regulatory protein n=1 Tax=Paenibacillus pasadenensis TaxID=217090 RepID=A0A2N5N4D0_9BACL|nr:MULTISPECIES: helix-turn-helix domain-containing protein [Paenibacillus]PLT45162.1 Arabinose operon regulatory protein [Paenibacillus pasadenensis]QGG55555.1 helix-turn-helix domain-containing protein [Paenibacillus sp. B01]
MNKIRRLWNKRRSVVVAWLLSYSAVLLLPILISFVNAAAADRALQSEIHRANDSLLEQVRYTMDKQIDLMKRLSMEIAWNDKLQTLMYSSQSAREAPYTAYQLSDEFRMYKTSYASIAEFYVVWERGDSVIRPGNIRDAETAYRTIHNSKALSFEKWKAETQREGPGRFIELPRSDAGKEQSSIAYVYRLPDGLNGKLTGAVVVMADSSGFQADFESISGLGGGVLLMLDPDGRPLLTNRPDAPELQAFLGADGRVSLAEGKAGDAELFHIRSAVSGLRYALIIPSSLYWEKAEYVRRFTASSIAVSLLGAGVLTWFFLRRNYSPIRGLVRSIDEREADVPEGRAEGNELKRIEQAIRRARSEKERIAEQLQKHQQVLRANMLQRLFKGRLDTPVSYEEAFRSFRMPLRSDRFAVLLLALENEDSLHETLSGIEAAERRRLIPFIIANVVEELCAKAGHAGYMAESDDLHACLVSLRPDAADAEAELRAAASEAQAFLRRYGMELTVSIGGIHGGWAGVAVAYQEAVDAMEYRMLLGKTGILSYRDIRMESRAPSGKGYDYPLQEEQQLINIIKAGDLEQAAACMDEIAERNFGNAPLSLGMARCLMFNLLATMLKAIHELGEGEERVLEEHPGWMERIMASTTFGEMQEELLRLLAEVCAIARTRRDAQVSQERQRSLRELVAGVNRFIEANYMDASLNVNGIGEQFAMKGSYLSRLYRSQTGEGLLDSIHRTRISRAKLLIEGKRESISEISRQVGYNDSATFIRVFKKYEGITPGKYRELA